MADIVTRYDQIRAAVVLAAHDYVGEGMAGVEVIDRDPIELRAEIFLHPRHQPAGQRFQILIVGAVLCADAETKLVAIFLRLLEPGAAVDLVGLRSIELAAPAVAGRAVPADLHHMRLQLATRSYRDRVCRDEK